MDFEFRSEATTPDEIAQVRDLARQAYADAVTEMIDGNSVAEIVASIDGARAAYARVLATAREQQQATQPPRPPAVPAGGSGSAVADIERLPASEKLRLGVGAAKR